MGYFKLRNMHLLKHGSNLKNFKPWTQEDHHNHLHHESQPAKQNQKKKNPSFEEPSLYLWLFVAYKGKGTMTTNSDTKLGVQRYHITRSSILIRNQLLYIDILMSHSPRINLICHIICVAKISKPRIKCLLLFSCFEHYH